jgi:hypothetical protein
MSGGLILYSASHPVLVRGEEPPRSQNCKNSIPGADLRGLLDGRVELYPVYWRLFYGVGAFKGCVRPALNLRFQEDGEYQLEEIIATSPSLEELTLWDVEIAGDFKEWAIQAPNLRHLSIRTPDDLGWNPGELPSLRSAEIEICDSFGDRDFGKFLTRFANITELKIYTHHPPVHTNCSQSSLSV